MAEIDAIAFSDTSGAICMNKTRLLRVPNTLTGR
jgi:hypothetical protein